MTTNVFDRGPVILATDSRWSARLPGNKGICYVDDTGFDKLFVDRNGGFACNFAGSAILIDQWKNWLASDMSTAPPDVYYNGISISICLVERDGQLSIVENQDINHEDGSKFAGSGALNAYECWKMNKSATKAVESAKVLDPCSGGNVKSADLPSGRHNVENVANLEDVVESLVKKGFVMYIANPQPIEFEKAAANDADVANLKGALASGAAQISAPYDAMYQDWSPEQKARLKSALDGLKARHR
ncbi:hypothetical protein [Chromobacterium phragmitis]|uniref:hypothetical protein n=1 Tax=Chromobacterium phragmitis TaxID=2202141 RepID=UPI0011AE77B0|nr:hypothetical protein [Chromobacterium phragmitis]